jgi:hypothetical protein
MAVPGSNVILDTSLHLGKAKKTGNGYLVKLDITPGTGFYEKVSV